MIFSKFSESLKLMRCVIQKVLKLTNWRQRVKLNFLSIRVKTKIWNQQIIFIKIPDIDLYYVVKLFRCADNRESYGYFGKAKSYSFIRFRNFSLPSGNRHLKILLPLHLEHDRPWFFRYRFGPIYFTGRTDASTETVVSRSLDNSGMFS